MPKQPSSPRRAKGEGSIYAVKDADGRIISYKGSIELPPGLNGKRKRLKASGKTKQEVAAKLRDLKRKSEAGLDLGTRRQTMNQFLAHWMTDVVKVKSEPKTIESYEDTIRLYIAPHIGHIQLINLTTHHCQMMYDALRKQPDSRTRTATTRTLTRAAEYAVKVLERALNRAIEERLIIFNPAAVIETQASEAKVQALTEAQAVTFLASIEGHRLEALYHLLLLCGLRQGEARAIEWGDLDLEHSTLSITKTSQRLRQGFITKSPKTRSSVRTISLPETTVGLLQKMKEQRTMYTNGLVFLSETGTALSPRNLDRQFKSLLKRAGLPETTLHSLRHTCATLLLDQGESAVNVASQLGHADAATTLRIYGHSVAASRARGVEALAKRLKKKEE